MVFARFWPAFTGNNGNRLNGTDSGRHHNSGAWLPIHETSQLKTGSKTASYSKPLALCTVSNRTESTSSFTFTEVLYPFSVHQNRKLDKSFEREIFKSAAWSIS